MNASVSLGLRENSCEREESENVRLHVNEELVILDQAGAGQMFG